MCVTGLSEGNEIIKSCHTQFEPLFLLLTICSVFNVFILNLDISERRRLIYPLVGRGTQRFA